MAIKKVWAILIVLMSVIGFSMAVIPGYSNTASGGVANGASAPAVTNATHTSSYVNAIESQANKYLQTSNKNVSLNSRNVNVSNLLFLPNKDAKDFYKIVNNTVAPTYHYAPAPMGIGDFGITNDSGNIVAQNFNTTSFEGVINLSSINAIYTSKCFEPRSVSFQLNTVLANVTLFGVTNYTMWTQNVIVYSTRTHELSFEDNVWNFSSPATYLTANSIYKSIGNNYPYSGVHIATGPTYRVNTPMLVYLYINTTNIDNRNAVYFNYSIPALHISNTYNEVIFNSTYGMPSTYKTPTDHFMVNGNKLTPTGYLLYDAELMVGGPGGGSTTQIYNINGNMNLLFLNSTTGKYMSVPSTYDYGADTGETSQGVSAYYTGTTEYLSTGPSILHGLWNISNNPGYMDLKGSISPSNGYVFVNTGSTILNSTISIIDGYIFLNAPAQWAATSLNGNFNYKLAPGTYSIQVLASDYKPVYKKDLTGSEGSTISESIILAKNLSYGVYTPLTAMDNAQLKNISSMGNGSASAPYMLLNPNRTIDPVFVTFNDFGFPEFPGIMLYNTSEYVSSLGISQPYVCGIPMPVGFYRASNVSLTDMGLGGDLTDNSMVVWYSSNDVVTLDYFTNSIVYINSSSDISYISNYNGNMILYECNDTANIVNNNFRNSFVESCNSGLNIISNKIVDSEFYYGSGEVNSTGNILQFSSETVNIGIFNVYDNIYYNSILSEINSTAYINESMVYDSYYCLVNSTVTSNMSNLTQSAVYGMNAKTTINNSNLNSSNIYAVNSIATINNSNLNSSYLVGEFGNMILNADKLSGSVIAAEKQNITTISTSLTDGGLLIGELSNIYVTGLYLSESDILNLYSNETLNNSTMDNYIDYNIYGNYMYNNDKFISNITLPFINSEFTPDTIVLYGNSVVTNSTFTSKNTDYGASVAQYYGTARIDDNTFYSKNVSLFLNPTGYGSSIFAYGGTNVINNNVFITISSPAGSVYYNYYADPADTGNKYVYGATFDEHNLTAGAQWELTLNGVTYNTLNSSITVLLNPGTYSYKAESSQYSNIVGTLVITSSSVTVNLIFKLAPKYPVTFTETGLPTGTMWNVTMNGVTESSNTLDIVFNIANGTYNYEISTMDKEYKATVDTNAIVVNGAPLTENVVFKQVTYPVTFTETGLPAGMTWYLNLSNGQSFKTNVSTLTFYAPNGTYYYTATPENSNYSVVSGGYIVNGTSIPMTASFHSIIYNVTFTESGLKSGTTWSVTFNGMTKTSSTSSITFTGIKNGTYSYSVSSVKGRTAPSSSSVTVNDGNIVVPVTYSTPVSYTLPMIAGIVSGIVAALAIGISVPILLKKH